jgi:glycine cleavage system pyridoxal-binding protein P
MLGVIVDLLGLYMLRTPEEYRANFCLADWRTLGAAPASVGQSCWIWARQTHGQEELSHSGPEDLRASLEIARGLRHLSHDALQHRFVQTWNHAHFLREALAQIPECRVPHPHAFFREFVVQVPGLAEEFVQELEDQGIFPGVVLGRDGYPRDWLLISASEQHQAADLAYFLKAFKQSLSRKSGKSFT